MEDDRTSRSNVAEDLVFRSAIGWPACGQMLPSALVAASSILLLTGSSPYSAIAAALLIVAVAMPVWLLVGTRYRIGDGNLTASTLYRRRRVPLTDITSVKRWPHWQYPIGIREDFALSSTRILISYADSRIFVSPRNERDFLAALGHPVST